MLCTNSLGVSTKSCLGIRGIAVKVRHNSICAPAFLTKTFVLEERKAPVLFSTSSMQSCKKQQASACGNSYTLRSEDLLFLFILFFPKIPSRKLFLFSWIGCKNPWAKILPLFGSSSHMLSHHIDDKMQSALWE